MKDNTETTDIHEFNFDNLKLDSKILIVGKPGSGKSVLVKYIIAKIAHLIPVGMVLNGTEDANKNYQSIFPHINVYHKYNENAIKQFLERQKLLLKDNHPNPWSILIIDDCSYDKKGMNSKLLGEMFRNIRQWKALIIVVTQLVKDVPPPLRENVDYIFLFKEKSESALNKIKESYTGGHFENYDQFIQIFKQIACDYGCMVVDNRNQSNELQDNIFYFKAKELSKINFGCKELKDNNKKRFNEYYDDINNEI